MHYKVSHEPSFGSYKVEYTDGLDTIESTVRFLGPDAKKEAEDYANQKNSEIAYHRMNHIVSGFANKALITLKPETDEHGPTFQLLHVQDKDGSVRIYFPMKSERPLSLFEVLITFGLYFEKQALAAMKEEKEKMIADLKKAARKEQDSSTVISR